MAPSQCDGCYALFAGAHFNKKMADQLQELKPDGICEQCSVSAYGPGPVANAESAYRLVVDPRDVDNGELAEAPFNALFRNGLSVARSAATDAELVELLEDGMWHDQDHEPPQLLCVCELSVDDLRAFQDDNGNQQFHIYNQTAPRLNSEGPEFGAHASVFMRVLPKNTESRKAHMKDIAGKLKQRFEEIVHDVEQFRGGALKPSNDKAATGAFAKATQTQ